MPLQDLPEDVLLDIFERLHVYDILSLRQTCRILELATRERAVWHEALSRHARQSGLPIPRLEGAEQSALSAHELEKLTVRALRFWSNWQAPQPTDCQQLRIRPYRPTTPARGARNLAVIFLPDHPGYILVLTLYDDVSHNRRYCFELWDISSASSAVFVDDIQVEALLGYAVNRVRGSSNAMIVTRRDPTSQQCITELYRIDLPRTEGSSCFQLVNHFPGYKNTIGLHGSRLVATDADQDVRVLDVDAGRLEFTLKPPVMLDDPTLRFAERQCMDAVIVDNFLLSFCKQFIYLYHLPPRSHDNSDSQEPPQLDAIAAYKWRWRIDTLVAQPRLFPYRGLPHGSPSAAPPPLIDILIRFDTWFPWPVNILHHFVLAPNPAYHSAAYPADPTALPYLLAQDGPFMVHALPSPLRIFTPSDVALGAHGTALWIDAATDGGAAAQAGDHGQRVAGKVLTRAPLPGLRARVRPGDDAVSPGLAAEVEGEGEEAQETGADGVREAPGPTMRGGTTVSVFQAHEGEARWNRVAVDEEGGRVAVGHVDGTVTVMSYVLP
ncbi:hypothetical protein VTO73DRAFT_2707 [Trametes versicolor]